MTIIGYTSPCSRDKFSANKSPAQQQSRKRKIPEPTSKEIEVFNKVLNLAKKASHSENHSTLC